MLDIRCDGSEASFEAFMAPRNDGGTDIPGPIDWEQASHWCISDPVLFTVETWCKMGPDYKYKLRTRVRPMCESEIIHAKLEGHSRDKILECYGIDEARDLRLRYAAHQTHAEVIRHRKSIKRMTCVNVVVMILSAICIYISLTTPPC